MIIAIFIMLYCTQLSAKSLYLEKIKLPPGFAIQIYAANVPDARSIAIVDRGTVFIGSRTAGRVYALIDSNH